MSGPHAVIASFSTSQEGLGENPLSSSPDRIPSDPTSHAAGDDGICIEAGCEPCHISNVSSSGEDEYTADLLHENGGVMTSPYIVFEDDLGRPRNDESTGQQEKEGAEEAMSDLEYQPENAWEPDSTSQSDVSDMRSEVEIDDEDEPISVSVESDAHSAKCFLERNWGCTCDCEGEAEENGIARIQDNVPQVYGLLDMVDYWRGLAVPDSIGRASPHAEVGESDDAKLDWFSILSGGDNRPKLDIQMSQRSSPDVQRTWDVDSIISWATCLSVNRGLYISYHSPPTRNLASNMHVFHQGTPLHIIPHLRLGSGRQSPQFGVYVFFPGISHVCRTTTYLTKNERRMWINELLLPAIRHHCPPDVVQHHPRSFDDVESKAYSRQREACSGMVHSKMDMHHYLPQEYLQQIWYDMRQRSERSDLAMFRGMFIVLSAKNIKLEAKSPTLQQCRAKIVDHLHHVLDWSKADLSNTWIDVGTEDTATSEKCTLLHKKHFNWSLTSQAGSARVETRRSHPLRSGGIAYAQRYNVNKDLFWTPAKQDRALFSEPNLEGLTCPPSLLDAWIVAARQYRNAGLATSDKSAPRLKRLRKVFQAMKTRIGFALDSSANTSFGVREEYRISWDLFTVLNPAASSLQGQHRSFWILPTAHVNRFMRWEFNWWLSAIEFVQSRASRRDANWEDHQRNMIMVTILLRSLKASVNCHHVARRSQMFIDDSRRGQG
ncbi:hypothetical protein FOPG_19459 [Fusarium oxysporum f. sp. conglutinans race 2 54008]|uniref:Uncharacterized protein n=1 Tax=Fusarium oxysporum f. sp. conglutinans race 2 54008 TaxID=1089457 RepID=X0GLU5_FUSOX|nr:hypothetical protein FOPG_19459 [Fusarium oxysporum f. sp. conglutinans race 2 54008]